MKIRTSFLLGGVTYNMEFEGKDDMDTLHNSIILSNPPRYCHECRNDEFFCLDSNKDKDGNIYVNVVCKKCFAKAKLGRYKSSGYFWHGFEKYVKKENIEKA